MNCKNCYWYDKCKNHEVCEDFEPININSIIEREYEESLKERVDEYQEIIDEFNN